MMRRFVIAAVLSAGLVTRGQNESLVFRYVAPGYNGTNAAHDAGGRNGPATVSTGVVQVGAGFYFNAGTSNAIFGGNSALLASNTQWTVAVGFRATNQASASAHYLYGEGCATNLTPYIAIQSFNTGLFYSTRSASSVSIDISPTNKVIDGMWHLATMVFVGSNAAGVGVTAYLDGNAIATSNRPTHPAIISNINRRAIGALERTTVSGPWRGDIDFAAGWNRALTQNEILSIYTQWRATKP